MSGIPRGATPRPDLAPGAYTYDPAAVLPLRVEPDAALDIASWRDWHDLDPCACGHPRRDHYGPGGGQGRCRLCARPGHPSHPFALDQTGARTRTRRRPRR